MRSTSVMKAHPPAPLTRKPPGNRRITRARGFRRAWLIADHLKRFDDGAGIILKEALTHLWLSEQRRWA